MEGKRCRVPLREGEGMTRKDSCGQSQVKGLDCLS